MSEKCIEKKFKWHPDPVLRREANRKDQTHLDEVIEWVDDTE